MIRLLLVAIFLLLHFIISIILLPIEWVIGKFNPQLKAKSSLRLVQVTFKIILFLCGVKTTVIGLENIPEDEPVLFIGNHRGFFDIVVSYSYMKGLTGFVAKKELNKVLFIRRWMRNLYCLFLDRNNMKEGLKTILTGIEYIKQGISIVIFPEGTRNKGDGIQPFHAGSFKFADKTNCKIIPMVQNNTEAVFENHLPWMKSAHTVLEFGKPIDITTFSKEERKNIASYTQHVIEEIYEKNKSLV
jgi:1-acyl-sn-glycerol-3-phosphate acyltransferase